jgi:NAD(P)-dependent dehydrogenase (short-subunit alcohol dehydrogenase family)
MLHYVTSKGAVSVLTKAIALELGSYNICVNTVAPGLTESERVVERLRKYSPERLEQVATLRAIKRRQMPEDLVGTILFLASADSDFITGQLVCVDGGRIMH